MSMNRRTFVGAAAGVAAAAAAVPTKSTMGVAATSYLSYWRPRETYDFLEYCHSIGAGGIQAPLASTELAYARKLRARAEALGMFVEVMAPLPKGDGAAAQFEAVIKAAAEAGVTCVRTGCLGGRRYETFASMQDWQAFVAESVQSVERAIPVLAKYKVRMALENHKDWTLDEFLALLKRYSTEWLGVCLDTGNNLALLDDPYQIVEKLAPFAYSTHIKDMGVAASADGFLLSEVVMGDGFLDMKRIVDTIRKHQPKTRLQLEMITRDPLKIPCLTDKYWATFSDRNGLFLARTLALVKQSERGKLPVMDGLTAEQKKQAEADNVKKCLAFAREKLALS